MAVSIATTQLRCRPLWIGLLLAFGCSQNEQALFPVSGMITYNNRPIPMGKLVFHPQFPGPGWMPVAVADDGGTFEASTKQQSDGVLPGRYIVTVVWRPGSDDEESPNLLPARYADPKTSGLNFELGPDADDFLTIELTD